MIRSNLNDFLNELSELTIKYGIAIGGCGCCDSPWLEEIKPHGHEIANNLSFDCATGKYEADDSFGYKFVEECNEND